MVPVTRGILELWFLLPCVWRVPETICDECEFRDCECAFFAEATEEFEALHVEPLED